MSKGTCLVLGANGFIGSHLVDELVQSDFKVVAFDHFSSQPKFFENPNIKIIKGDIFSVDDIRSALAGVDYLIHSFSATTPATADIDPYTDLTSNLVNSVRIFDECVRAKIKKIVFISSGGVIYGALSEHRRASENDPALPVSPYGISKLGIERYLGYFKRKYGINHFIYRLSNPYGPRQVAKHSQGVIPTFIGQITQGEEITIYGDGSSSRDYIYIKDAAKMIVSSFWKHTIHDIYNLGSGRQTSLKHMLKTIEKLTNRTANIRYITAPSTFLKKSQIDVSLLQKEFGLRAKTTFQDGIKQTLDI